MPNFREAKCVELHDSNVALTTNEDSYSFTALTGRTEHSDKPAYRLNLGDICMIAEALGVETLGTVKVPYNSNQSVALTSEHQDVSNVEIPIFKAHHDYSDSDQNEKIIKIECGVLSERLVNIKTTTVPNDDDKPYIEEITYSGSFTIWWEPSKS